MYSMLLKATEMLTWVGLADQFQFQVLMQLESQNQAQADESRLHVQATTILPELGDVARFVSTACTPVLISAQSPPEISHPEYSS